MNAIINFLFYAVRAGTPLLLGTTGEIITEKTAKAFAYYGIDKIRVVK